MNKNLFNELASDMVIVVLFIVVVIEIAWVYQYTLEVNYLNASLAERAQMIMNGTTPDKSIVMQVLNELGIK